MTPVAPSIVRGHPDYGRWGYEIIGATADLQQPCWMVLTVYRRASLE